MNRMAKVVAMVVAVVAVLVVVLAILVKVLVTPERVKAVVVPLAESALQREVKLGEINIGLFSGIELHDLTIVEKHATEPLLSVDLVKMRFQWLPLLARRVIVDEILLERPRVQIRRDVGGTLSIADLLAGAAGVPEGSGESQPPREELPVSLLVTDLQIEDGAITFVDQATRSGEPVHLQLTGLAAQADGFVLDGSVALRAQGVLNGAPLAADGTLHLREKTTRLHIDLQGLDMLPLAPYYRDNVPGRLTALQLDLMADLIRSPEGVAATGTATGRNLDLQLEALPAAPISKATVRADFDLTTRAGEDAVDLKRLVLDYNGLSATLNGRLTALASRASAERLTLAIPALDLARAMTALPRGLPGNLDALSPSGVLRADLQLAGVLAAPRDLVRSGTVLVEQLQGTVAGVRPTVNGRIALTPGQARIEQMTVALGDLAVAVSGAIDSVYTAPQAELLMVLPRVDLAATLAKAPPELVKGWAGLTPAGQVEGRARLRGPLAEPARLLESAELALAGVQATVAGQRPELNGRLKFGGGQLVTEGLTVRLGNDTAQLDGTLSNLFDRPMIATLDVTAPLLQGGGAAAVATGGEVPVQKSGDLGPFDLPLTVSGAVRIGETTWKGVAIRDFRADYALRDNQLTLGRLSARAAGGTVAGNSRIDLRQPGLAYQAEFSADGVQAGNLLAALAPSASGVLSGTTELKGSLQGRGTRWETLRNTLDGDSVLTLADGALVSPALASGLSAFLGIPELDRFDFRELRAKLRAAGGRLLIDGSLLGRRVRLYPKGTLGFDGTLQLAVDTRISPELAVRIDGGNQLAVLLADADGWSQVPLLVTGSVQQPRFGLDPEGVRAQTTRTLQQKLQRGLDTLLGGKPEPQPEQAAPAEQAPPTAAPREDPARKFLDKSLKELLNR